MPTAFSCPAWQCFQMQVFYTKELGKLLLERGADPCHVCRISWVKAGEEAINDPAVCPSSSVPGLGKSLGLSAGTWMCCRVAQLALLEVTPTRQFDGGFHVLQHYLAVGRAFRPQSSDEGFGRPLALLYPSLEANAHWHLGSPKRGDPSFPGTCPRALSPLDAMQTTGVTGVFGHRFSPMRRSLKHYGAKCGEDRIAFSLDVPIPELHNRVQSNLEEFTANPMRQERRIVCTSLSLAGGHRCRKLLALRPDLKLICLE